MVAEDYLPLRRTKRVAKHFIVILLGGIAIHEVGTEDITGRRV